MASSRSGGDSPAREQLSALRNLLVLAMLLTQQDSQGTILNMVANAVESLGRCQFRGMYFDGRWVFFCMTINWFAPVQQDLETTAAFAAAGAKAMQMVKDALSPR